MTIEDLNIIWLDLFPFLTYQRKVKILALLNFEQDVKLAFLSNPDIREMLTDEEIFKMQKCCDEFWFNSQLEKFKSDGIEMITKNNPNYPNELKEIENPPLCLYCKGNLQLLSSFCIGIVGTRKPSEYGIIVTEQYAKAFSKNNITVVSGLATGVDTIAHKTCLENYGKTIAVLAGGLYKIYPAINTNLAKQMTQDNLIMSENSPNITASTYMFPIRNRIIAGLSKAVLVTEASEKSGTLHTVNYAFEAKRKIFAVPGRINSDLSKGTNNLIKNKMAEITLSPDDIFDALNIKKHENEKNLTVQLDFSEQLVLNYIKTEKKTFQEIADHTKLSVAELNVMLLELEMEDLIIKLPNNSYIMK